MTTSQPTSLFRSRAFYVLVVLLLMIAVGGYSLHRILMGNLWKEVETRLLDIGQGKVGQITAWRSERLGDAIAII